MRVYRIPFSTNVERVALAAGLKDLEVEWIDVDPDDRGAVRAISGQELVPVLADGDTILHDSPAILRWLEERFAEPPLWPADEARRAEADIFVEWFNAVWKRPPNRIAADEAEPGDAEWLRASCTLFESLLSGREHLLGEFGIADVIAFPFLKYALLAPPASDTDPFHAVLHEHLSVDGRPLLEAWIRRVDERPRAR